jgi:hypothetical protein
VEKIEIKYSFILQTDFNSFLLKGKVAMPQALTEAFIQKTIKDEYINLRIKKITKFN